MSKFSYRKEDDWYVIYDGDQVLTTPGQKRVVTMYQSVAERIVADAEKYGKACFSSHSILPWVYTMTENFVVMGHEKVRNLLISSFLLRGPDWTARVHFPGIWKSLFNDWSNRCACIVKWLDKASVMQMTAACCIGNAYESISISLALATIMECFEGEERDQMFVSLAEAIGDFGLFGPANEIYHDFKLFEFYYGVHLEEDGPILDGIVPKIGSEDETELDDLICCKLSIEHLIGRNYLHYTDFMLDEDQPEEIDLSDMIDEDVDDEDDYFDDEDDEEDEDAEDYDEDDESDEDDEDLSSVLSLNDCWIKRFRDDTDPNTAYLMCIAIDDNGTVTDWECVKETTEQYGGCGFSLFIPGMDFASGKDYELIDDPPQVVVKDIQLLLKGKSIPLDADFIGKRLPQKMIEFDGNGGINTEYTYALQSAYRLAYMHMSVDTDESGVIESLFYSTYQSTGDAYGDMFSRPRPLSDRHDEAMDMLLYIYDMYTDEELFEEFDQEL